MTEPITPDQVTDLFADASHAAARACASASPIAGEDAYIRGGLAAVLTEAREDIATFIDDHAASHPLDNPLAVADLVRTWPTLCDGPSCDAHSATETRTDPPVATETEEGR
jgi:hypothetical protein